MKARERLYLLGLLPAALLSAWWCARAGAAELDATVQQRIRAGTFEVVQLKPPDGAVQYESPLPLELIPFQQRTDKYRSIGTAFAIGDNRYVTAAHVLLAGMASQFGPPAIRDAAGNVYAISQVLKYADRRDFVVFSLTAEPKGVEPLTLGAAPKVNDTVYAVGNALGEGIVIRDGVYTSSTPEELNGEWQWLRFSAAASPGNSGGPLVDQQGRVVGVVLRKSAAENLNYALPVSEITGAASGEGRIEDRSPIRLVVMDAAGTLQIHQRFKLPLSLPQFYQAVLAALGNGIQQARNQLIAQNAMQLFPHGSGSDPLLHRMFSSPFPRIVHQDQGGTWTTASAQPQVFQLQDNGFLRVRGGFIRLRAPDDVELASLYADSKMLMDLILKGYVLRRQVGGESVRVTSLGGGEDHGTYVDHYGRIWQIRTWNIPFADQVLSALCLPTPEGYAIMMARVRSDTAAVELQQQEFLADYVYVTLTGTLARWQEYLAQKSLQPRLFQSVGVQIDPDQRVQYQSKRFDLTITPKLIKLSKDSLLSLFTSFYSEPAGDAVWDVAGLTVRESSSQGNWVNVSRIAAPDASLPQAFQGTWAKIAAREFPYDSSIVASNGSTRIRTVAAAGGPRARNQDKVQYVLTAVAEGTQTQAAMGRELASLQRSFRPLEH